MRKVQYNHDGDLLFSCSDDARVCVFRTYDYQRMGVINTKDACKSIDVTKDSKYLLTSSIIHGFNIFSVTDGSLKSRIKIDSMFNKYVELSLGDKQFLVVSDDKKKSTIRIYDFQKALGGDSKPEKVIPGPDDMICNQVSWGPLNKTLYMVTDSGRMLVYDLSKNKYTLIKDIHKEEIISFTYTHDFTMMITCS